MTALEERVLEYLQAPTTPPIVSEGDIAHALDLGDPLDVAAALHVLQTKGLAHHCSVRGRMWDRRADEIRSVGWMCSLKGVGRRHGRAAMSRDQEGRDRGSAFMATHGANCRAVLARLDSAGVLTDTTPEELATNAAPSVVELLNRCAALIESLSPPF